MWKRVGENLERYRVYPRLVGETGGKDFIVAPPSADVEELVTAVVRGGFEYQGPKCSAPSRVFVPAPMWRAVSCPLPWMGSPIGVGDRGHLATVMAALLS